ncbi:MAG: FAD-binding protein [Deltaproteobacteria bacterium]|nr:FAD-binding protein [Deltaproteobacteria bacterium]
MPLEEEGRERQIVNLQHLGEVISTDLLIIGGGIGGIVSAIKAKEHPVDVLIVEKATAGWAGKAPKGGGILWVLTAEDDLEKFVDYHVRVIGDFLNDQELLYAMARETLSAIEQIESWGAKIVRNEDGSLDTFRPFGPWSLAAVDLDMLNVMRKTARKRGVKIVNKVQVVDLLKQDERVVGAVGFHVISGRFYVIQAKATVLANGSCNYRVMPMWSCGRGDGIAAAYRAGAEMRNAEFGNFYNILLKGSLSPIIGADYAICNAAGERLCERYLPGPPEPDISIASLMGMEKEVMEGKGPVCFDPSEMHVARLFALQFKRWKRPTANAFWRRLSEKEQRYGSDPSPRPEAIPGFIGELSPVRVDHDMRTSLNGLWAIGDTSYAGSAWAGAVPGPPGRIRGSGLMNAILSALRGGPSAARSASETPPPHVDPVEVKQLKESLFAPMRRDKGYLPLQAVDAVRDVISPIKYSIRKSKNRLEEALSRIGEVRVRLSELWAKDYHGLSNCNEARNMVLCAEMYFKAALLRTESRGWHFREDYPQRDDENWLKWITMKQENGKMVFSTEALPIDRYRVKP